MDTICLDENYSTTRLITQEKPEILNNPEDKFETVLFLPMGENRKGEGGLRTKGYFKKSYEDKPLISVITVVYNGEKYLEETIQSVINQTYDNVEYIIIDGGSTDRTSDIIKKYEDRIDYWVSEKDKGIYDAMNKGVSGCIGEIIGIVNADDYLYLNILEHITTIFDKNVDFLYGNVHIIDSEGKIIGEKNSLPNEQIDVKIYSGMPFPHPSVFVNINTYKKIGLFDISFRLSADFDFLLRLLEKKTNGISIMKFTGAFRTGGQSGGYSSLIENIKVLKKRNINSFLIISIFIKNSLKIIAYNYFPKNIYNFFKKRNINSLNKIYK